ncbi:diacylglycerol kinase [Patescibacteria group bacterium]|uniref:Diacylglycerol kinase n=1 Tax=candidate division WWE3 bacterium TaxID=2053526 RepID=A0A928TW08_UNCKA|nr:diacylglycerol kinase [candidate division WWE3 bacterium]MCL4732401.1 diacylglycerol kinase [Patescibacteria group bacterium]MDL1952827.1 diacylglycerol kinase family protein [Candidatus Uhrbacteria bacterium UHB]RIL01063.1 MAG: diacylglycerol kinase [Candidatus Uhrbacteria bacterium]
MKRFSTGLTNSFRAAWRGIMLAIRNERTFRVMLAAAFLVIALVSTLPLATAERLTLLLLTGFVLVLELLNTMVERLVDLLKPRLSAYVRDVKDLMAAAVLVAAGFALLTAVLVFAPHIRALLSSL